MSMVRGACAMLLAIGSAAGAQSPTVVQGRVVRVTTRGPIALPGTMVTLHRIGASSAGPVDSARADRFGRYRFRVASPDTQAMYLPTTRHGGLAYFASPVRAGDPSADGEIEVFDTTSAPVRIRVTGRHLVVSAPDADGNRTILDVYELSNDTVLTRLGSPAQPSFVAELPELARDARAAQGDFTGDAVVAVPGGLGVVAPMSPGIRQLAVSYLLPPRAFPLGVTLNDTVAVVEVLLEEPAARAEGDSLAALGAVSSEGRSFVRFLGRDLPRGRRLEVLVPSAAGGGVARWGWLAALSVAALGAIGWSLRRRPAPVVVAAAPPPRSRTDELRGAIAGVDATLADSATAVASHAALRDYRAGLQAELDAALAGDQDRP
ncbi:MAG: hypothetical protein IT361_16000 [Gemmatimonadaceae bacterium]|nr:hypothetical protein [Gemmatimonadaceae bacterium]